MNPNEILEKILKEDNRYPRDAYFFFKEVLDFTEKKIANIDPRDRIKEVTPKQILEGLKHYSVKIFGISVKDSLESLGITSTEDIGNIALNLACHNLLGNNNSNTIDDFINVYDFNKVFNLSHNIVLKPSTRERQIRGWHLGVQDSNREKASTYESFLSFDEFNEKYLPNQTQSYFCGWPFKRFGAPEERIKFQLKFKR